MSKMATGNTCVHMVCNSEASSSGRNTVCLKDGLGYVGLPKPAVAARRQNGSGIRGAAFVEHIGQQIAEGVALENESAAEAGSNKYVPADVKRVRKDLRGLLA